MIKIKESHIYKFSFYKNITKGHVTAEIQDKNKKDIVAVRQKQP